MTDDKSNSRKTDSMQAVDAYVGYKIKWFRIQRDLSQHELAERLGISYQQLHKYENGSNSASASRLAEIARALDVPVSALFDGLGDETMAWFASEANREYMLLAKYFNQIPTHEQRHAVRHLIQALAEEE